MTQSASLAAIDKVLMREKSEEPEGRSAPSRKARLPLLKAWPPGYEKGRFRLVHGGVLLFAKGKPMMKIEEDGRTSSLGIVSGVSLAEEFF